MDVARYRSADPRLTRVAGFDRLVPLRPLTRGEMIAIDDRLAQIAGEHLHAAVATSMRISVLELATGCSDAGDLTGDEVDALFSAWEQVQDASNPDVDQLGAEVELQLIEGRGYLISDAQAAGHASSPSDFYGLPVSSLTDGQLAYYLVLDQAHERWSEKRCRTKATLRKLARRSDTTKARRGER